MWKGPSQLNWAGTDPFISEFEPTFHTVSKNWQRLPASQKDDVFFASLDFPDGQAIYQRVSGRPSDRSVHALS